ncbi:hypothetical protein [Nocardia sp. NPDC057455]|uniref:hypothetical protein n=1 Tax=Nocardia sp. NPDC057455 TaxID=3346138 RepID=UPI00366A915C
MSVKCLGFQWIGQPFTSCDSCGKPYWEHTHDERMRNGRLFRKLISAEERAAVRRKWEGYR